jgi:hypothetical protein
MSKRLRPGTRLRVKAHIKALSGLKATVTEDLDTYLAVDIPDAPPNPAALADDPWWRTHQQLYVLPRSYFEL